MNYQQITILSKLLILHNRHGHTPLTCILAKCTQLDELPAYQANEVMLEFLKMAGDGIERKHVLKENR